MNIDEPTLDALSKLLDKYHLSELTYQTGDQKITLKKEAPAPVTPAVAHRLPTPLRQSGRRTSKPVVPRSTPRPSASFTPLSHPRTRPLFPLATPSRSAKSSA